MEQYLNKHFLWGREGGEDRHPCLEKACGIHKTEYLKVHHAAQGICGHKHLHFNLFLKAYPIFGGFSNSEHYQLGFLLFQIK